MSKLLKFDHRMTSENKSISAINANDKNFEDLFWLQVLGDHMRFILAKLAVKEEELIKTTKQLKQTSDDLLNAVRASTAVSVGSKIALCQEIGKLKLEIQRRQLIGDIEFGLPPTFISHMINELEEYVHILTGVEVGDRNVPQDHVLHVHKLWLKDISGHAAINQASLDFTEVKTKKKMCKFKKVFKSLTYMADEFASLLRTGLTEFPALDKLNDSSAEKVKLFNVVLAEMEEMCLSHKLLGSITPLMIDHMLREHSYYLICVANKTNKPVEISLDPTSPRVGD